MPSADPPVSVSPVSPPESAPAAFPVATVLLIVACAGAFAASYALGGGLDLMTLIVCGAKDRDLIVGEGEWWRLFSAGFLHAGLIHLLVNLYALRALGFVVERLWGTRRFFVIYVAALGLGNLASLAVTRGVSVGASGAVFGLFGAVAVFSTVYRQFVRPAARKRLWINLAVVAALNVALGILVPFIDNAAHAGGLVAGVLAALILRPTPARWRANANADLAVRVAFALALGLVAWSLIRAVEYARASEWVLLAHTRLEPRHVSGGQFILHVPSGWQYEPPKRPGDLHVFVRPGFAVIGARVIPPSRGADTALLARGIAEQWSKEGAKLILRREIAIADSTGTDLLFQLRRNNADWVHREVVFATPSDQIVHVSCGCAARRYRLLEIIFDKVIQSIQVLPAAPGDESARKLWNRIIENPRDAEACVFLATHYRLEGRADAAEQVLRLALGVRPDYADAHDQLAYLYATASGSRRKPDLAVRHALRALALRPDTPMYLATLAVAYEAAGQRAKALEAARRAAALAPADAHYTDLVKRLEGG